MQLVPLLYYFLLNIWMNTNVLVYQDLASHRFSLFPPSRRAVSSHYASLSSFSGFRYSSLCVLAISLCCNGYRLDRLGRRLRCGVFWGFPVFGGLISR